MLTSQEERAPKDLEIKDLRANLDRFEKRKAPLTARKQEIAKQLVGAKKDRTATQVRDCTLLIRRMN